MEKKITSLIGDIKLLEQRLTYALGIGVNLALFFIKALRCDTVTFYSKV